MPRYTQWCPTCHWQGDIWAAPYEMPPCPDCGQGTQRLWVGRSAGVADDSWPGGKTFENLGHEPVTLYSRSELKRELKARGLVEYVRHVPLPGSDKSPHTTSWATTDPYTLEAARVLVERVTGLSPSPDPPPRTVYPLATPDLVNSLWPS